MAADEGHLEVVDVLLKAGANTESKIRVSWLRSILVDIPSLVNAACILHTVSAGCLDCAVMS